MAGMGRLAHRRALVTGAGRGLGAAVARRLAAEGAAVVLAARTRDEVTAVAAEIGGEPVVADVGDRDGWQRALDAVGDVDVLVANAGVVWPLEPFAATDVDEWERDLAINLFGAVRAVRAVLPGMLKRRWGRIVTVTSGAARPPGMPSANAYSTSKAALEMFTLHLADEIAGRGVTVNALRPGVVDTGMQDYMRAQPREQVGAAFHDRFHGLHRRGELAGPDPVAGWVVDTLLSDAHGQVLDVRDR
jgi:NAD(P)-dependent dehydrogenase (short-subunit alcohol dehydrogenase family)